MDLADAAAGDEITELKRRLAQEQARRQDLDTLYKAAERDLVRLQDEIVGIQNSYGAALSVVGDVSIPEWSGAMPRTPGVNVVRPVLLLSDLHFQEVVSKANMGGMNEYNHEISVARFERVIQKTIEFCRLYVSGLEFDGLTVGLLGDVITGTIHDELARTNDMTTPEAIVFWAPHIASAMKLFADEFGLVHLVCVDGNHDRQYRKKAMKMRAQDSWAWVLYSWVAHSLADDDRISVSIPEASEIIIPIFDTKFLVEHGDEGVGGSAGNGIGGIYPSIMRKAAKSSEVYSAMGETFDYMVIGHFHQLIYGQRVIVNGSLKGYDEYARSKKFPFERPQQALFFVAPERGLTMRTAIHGD